MWLLPPSSAASAVWKFEGLGGPWPDSSIQGFVVVLIKRLPSALFNSNYLHTLFPKGKLLAWL